MERTLVDPRRVRPLKDRPAREGPIIYWMSRDQRSRDNWALLRAVEMSIERGSQLCVAFCLVPEFMGATWRQYAFMIGGLVELERELVAKGIGFRLLLGQPWTELPPFLHEVGAGAVVTDFDPIKIKMDWKRKVASGTFIPFYEVDAHNTVPCWLVSSRKIESFDSYRRKLIPHLDAFLTEFPQLPSMKEGWRAEGTDWEMAKRSLRVDTTVPEVEWIEPGEKAAREMLDRFCANKLSDYPQKGMDPNQDGQSNLSAYLHFGQLSGQRVALQVRRSEAPEEAKEKYLDRVIVQREIADNFCLHNPNYDSFGGFPEWARRSIDEHRSDPRDHVYTLEQFEKGLTHDPLWNAAQTEMVKLGKMHGSLRPYWASKILEWTRTPEQAYEFAIHLNDKYQLDGRDASGYSGIAMVIGGLYDRPWASKEVLGKVKKLTYTGQRMRFDVHNYCEYVQGLK